VKLDFLIVADRAEAVNGKLYMIGGAWDRLGLSTIPGQAVFDVAVGVLVDYHETNVQHRFELALEDEDNKVVLGPIAGQFEVGRPPGMKAAQAQRFIVVVRGPFPIPRTGAFLWILALDGRREQGTKFWVDKVAAPTLPPPSA
jgi:hypothetical protein